MLTRFARSELPYPRVRDHRGWTRELESFLRRTYFTWACPGFLQGYCRRTGRRGCLDCRYDDVWCAPWMEPVHAARVGEVLEDVGWGLPVLVVDESPSADHPLLPALHPRTASGQHFEALLGAPLDTVGSAVNLFEDRLDWDDREAAMRARLMLDVLRRRLADETSSVRWVLTLGRRVSHAFAANRPWLTPPGGDAPAPWVVPFPHPSPRSRWWNVQMNRMRAAFYLRMLKTRVA